MKNDKMEELTNKIQEKIGEEASNLILDDIAMLLTDTQNTNKEIEAKDKEIEKLKQDKETLQKVNGNLLQQVSMADEEPKNEPKEEPKIIDFRTAFDEKGNFKQ